MASSWHLPPDGLRVRAALQVGAAAAARGGRALGGQPHGQQLAPAQGPRAAHGPGAARRRAVRAAAHRGGHAAGRALAHAHRAHQEGAPRAPAAGERGAPWQRTAPQAMLHWPSIAPHRRQRRTSAGRLPAGWMTHAVRTRSASSPDNNNRRVATHVSNSWSSGQRTARILMRCRTLM
jgi:hypothetical protein